VLHSDLEIILSHACAGVICRENRISTGLNSHTSIIQTLTTTKKTIAKPVQQMGRPIV
jgi:hypothetical protein